MLEEFYPRPSLLRRAFRTLLAVGVPAFFLVRLLTPQQRVLYVSWEPFQLSWNPLPYSPTALGEILNGYPTTFLAMGALAVYAFFRLWPRVQFRPRSAVWMPVCFLPTYVFGIESLRRLRWATACRFGSTQPYDLRTEISMAFAGGLAVLLLTVIAGGIAAAALGHRRTGAGAALSFPPVVIAIALAVGLNWYLWWIVVQPNTFRIR